MHKKAAEKKKEDKKPIELKQSENKKKDEKKAESLVQSLVNSKINPSHPEGLVPPPHTVDTKEHWHEQLKNPLIPENQQDRDDLRSFYNPAKQPERKNYV